MNESQGFLIDGLSRADGDQGDFVVEMFADNPESAYVVGAYHICDSGAVLIGRLREGDMDKTKKTCRFYQEPPALLFVVRSIRNVLGNL